MKKIPFILIVFLTLFLISGCQKEDVYNPKEKIQSIFDYTISSKSPYISFLYVEEKISKAVFYDQTIFEFEYNEDDQVSAIYSYYGNKPYGYVTMTYLDKKLSKVEYYDNSNVVFQKDTFYRNDGQIYGYKSYLAAKRSKDYETITQNSRLFQTYMHVQNPKSVKAITADVKSGFVLISQTNVTYTKGNVTQLETVYQNGFTVLSNFTYDSEKNPLYGLPFAFMDYMNFPSAPISSYCKNNFISASYCEYYVSPGDVTIENFELVYQKNDYPSQIYSNINFETVLRWQFNYIE